jgi:HK97 family phage prohead protease
MSESAIERRTVAGEVRADATDAGPTTLSGYAAVFDVETVIEGWASFREVIRKGAFADAIKRDDVRGLFNHDPNYVLGRTANGTMRLREDDHGLHYEIDLNPNDPEAVSVGAKVARGDVSQSSFAFQVDAEEWEYPKGQLPLRSITRVAPLYDASVVTYPAYATTSVSARAFTQAATTGVAPRSFAADPASRMREMILRWKDRRSRQ